jgi:hypothetical protein
MAKLTIVFGLLCDLNVLRLRRTGCCTRGGQPRSKGVHAVDRAGPGLGGRGAITATIRGGPGDHETSSLRAGRNVARFPRTPLTHAIDGTRLFGDWRENAGKAAESGDA